MTFTILNGSTPVGGPVSATVSAGSGNASYSLPAGTPVGTYTIRAVYTDAGNFLGSVDTSQSLTVTQPAAIQVIPRDTAFRDGDGRHGVHHAASRLRRGSERQPRNRRQQHDRHRVAGERCGTADWYTHCHRLRRYRHIHQSGRQHGRDHHAQVLERQPRNGDFGQYRRQPSRRQQAGRHTSSLLRRRPARPSPSSRSSRKKTSTETSSPPTARTPSRWRGAPSDRQPSRAAP